MIQNELISSERSGQTLLPTMIVVSLSALAFLLFLVTSCMAEVDKAITPVDSQNMHNEEGLSNTRSSIDELIKEVLEEFARNDRKALEALALTEDEVKRYVWPYDKHSKPGVNMTFEYWWGELHKRSAFRLTQTMQKFGGKKVTLISFRFAEDPMKYNNATVYRDTILTIQDEEGQTWDAEMFGSIFELNGKFKIFSYIYK